MSVKTVDDHEVFTCDRCAKAAAPGVGLPDGWVQIAVADPPKNDRFLQFCPHECARAYGKQERGA